MLCIERSVRALCRAHSKLTIQRSALAAALAFACWLSAQITPAETVAVAESSPAAQQEATGAFPMDQLTEAAQAKLWPVISSPSIYRRLPTEVVNCDRDMYLTLVRNPEIVVGMWKLMEVTELDMRRSGPFTFDCDDKAGTTSQAELVYGTPNLHIFYADTLYEGSLFARPVNGRVVLLLRSEYYNDEHGRPQAKSVMDAFIRIDHAAAKLVARTMSPLVVRTADHNFSETFRFFARVQEAAEQNGPGMRQLATRLENVEPARQRQLADVATLVDQRAAARREQAAAQGGGSPAVSRAMELRR